MLDMGEEMKILDLAYQMLRIKGLRPERILEIQFTGLRPGEKLSEELVMREEDLQRTPHPKVFLVETPSLDRKGRASEAD